MSQALAAAPSAPSTRAGKAPPQLVMVPTGNPQTTLLVHEALNPNPQRWFRIMERADLGDTGPMIDMFADSRDRDQHLDGVARKRAQSMMGRPIVFRPADGLESDERALAIARAVRHILLFESKSFRGMLTHLMQAPVDGYSVAPIRWTTNRRGWHVPNLEWSHANRYCFDARTLELSFYVDQYRSHGNVEPLSAHPDAFVAHVPMGGRSDYPWRRGAMRAAIIPSFIKRNGLKFWLTLAERFGMPLPYATVPEGEDHDDQSTTDLIAVAEKALQNLGRIWSMVVTENIKIATIPGSDSNATGEIHKELIAWANTTQSIGLLGQNLTTEVSGGSFAAAESHRFVAGELHLADATELAETITQQLCEPIVRYNWPGEPVPICEISTGQKQVFQVEDVREGIASPDERRATLGHAAQPDGKGAEIRDPRGVVVQVPEQIGTPEPESAEPAKVEPAAPEVEPVATDAPVDPNAEVKDPSTALNGAQVLALKDIVIDVALGTYPRDTGIQLIVAAFPLSEAEAESIMGSVGAGFVPPVDMPLADVVAFHVGRALARMGRHPTQKRAP